MVFNTEILTNQNREYYLSQYWLVSYKRSENIQIHFSLQRPKAMSSHLSLHWGRGTDWLFMHWLFVNIEKNEHLILLFFILDISSHVMVNLSWKSCKRSCFLTSMQRTWNFVHILMFSWWVPWQDLGKIHQDLVCFLSRCTKFQFTGQVLIFYSLWLYVCKRWEWKTEATSLIDRWTRNPLKKYPNFS